MTSLDPLPPHARSLLSTRVSATSSTLQCYSSLRPPHPLPLTVHLKGTRQVERRTKADWPRAGASCAPPHPSVQHASHKLLGLQLSVQPRPNLGVASARRGACVPVELSSRNKLAEQVAPGHLKVRSSNREPVQRLCADFSCELPRIPELRRQRRGVLWPAKDLGFNRRQNAARWPCMSLPKPLRNARCDSAL